MELWKPYKIENAIEIDRLYSLYNVAYNENFHFDGEIHDFWECVYVQSGGICVSGDDRVYNVGAGDIVFHKPMELHKFFVTEKQGAQLVIFSFTMNGKYADYFRDKVFCLNVEQQRILSDIASYAPEKIPYRNYMENIYTSPVNIQKFCSYVTLLMLSLLECGSAFESVTTEEAILFKTAVDYMASNVDCAITVADISKHCLVSESTLKRIFNKYAGISVHRYFLSLKLKAAAQLLKTGKNVTEVTELLNFSSQSYFSFCFKRETGKSPSQLRTKV